MIFGREIQNQGPSNQKEWNFKQIYFKDLLKKNRDLLKIFYKRSKIVDF